MEDYRTYLREYNDLTKSLMASIFHEKDGKSFIISPFSILMLLAVASDAVSSRAREEIARVIAPGVNYDDVIRTLQGIRRRLEESNAFVSSNAVCVKNSICHSIVSGYSDRLQELFGGKIFTSKNMAADVNEWVNNQTKGLISNVFDISMNELLLCLLNATSFEGKWTKNYTISDIEFLDFNNIDGTKTLVPMLDITEGLYVEDDLCTGFVKPYKDIGYSFMALLPKKEARKDLEEAVHALNFSEIFLEKKPEKVLVLLPEFTCKSDWDLRQFCHEQGIQEIFSENADFSPISTEALQAESIKHKAYIEVTRRGTKAAAYTGIYFATGCAPEPDYKTVHLDRPFIYAIIHNETALPVFTGVVTKLRDVKNLYQI